METTQTNTPPAKLVLTWITDEHAVTNLPDGNGGTISFRLHAYNDEDNERWFFRNTSNNRVHSPGYKYRNEILNATIEKAEALGWAIDPDMLYAY